jgi:hypothetical protein
MTTGAETLFAQHKLMLAGRRNRLHIEGLEAPDSMKSYDKLNIEFPQVVIRAAGGGYGVRINQRWIWMKEE